MKTLRNCYKKLSLLMIATLVLSTLLFTGCGIKDSGKNDANLGTYTAKYASMGDFSIPVEDAFSEGFTIELKSKGKCTITVDGDSANGKWTLDGKDFNVKGGGIDCSGTLDNGVMELVNVMGAGLDMTLVNPEIAGNYDPDSSNDDDGSSGGGLFGKLFGGRGGDDDDDSDTTDTPEATDDEEADEPTEPETRIELVEKTAIQKYWNGDWYGYFYISEGTGDYEALNYRFWDAAGIVDLDEEGNGTITVWYAPAEEADGDSYDDPLAFGNINVSYDNGFGQYGTALSTSGWAFVDDPCGRIGEGDWVIDPDNDDFPDMMYFGSTYTDDGGSMFYNIVLRPWGNRWDDVTDDVTYVMPGFNTWYIALLDEGWALPMDFKSDPVKTMEERQEELLAPIEKIVTVDGSDSANGGLPGGGQADTDESTDNGSAGGTASVGETYDNVTPSGSSYSWGNITVTVPDGMTTTNGGIGNPDDENSLWIQNGTKYLLVQISDIDKAKSDVESTKSFNNGVDASFSVNGTQWNTAKYDYSGSPCWQGYATIGGTVYEVMSYGYDFGDSQTLTVLSSLK